MNTFTSNVILRWQKQIDDLVFGEIKRKAVENGIETEYVLNEKAIMNAIKKQVPEKTIADRFPWGICPNCRGSIYLEKIQEHIQNKETTYCEHCGQAIDWSDTK